MSWKMQRTCTLHGLLEKILSLQPMKFIHLVRSSFDSTILPSAGKLYIKPSLLLLVLVEESGLLPLLSVPLKTRTRVRKGTGVFIGLNILKDDKEQQHTPIVGLF
jgi:hypothetical protein